MCGNCKENDKRVWKWEKIDISDKGYPNLCRLCDYGKNEPDDITVCNKFWIEDIMGAPEKKARLQSMANFYQQMEESIKSRLMVYWYNDNIQM